MLANKEPQWPFFLKQIPEVSLVTSPTYLLAIFPEDFDERILIDVHAMKRQVDSFLRLWKIWDALPVAGFGVVPPSNVTT
jgi:hypothetical protein